MMKNKYRFLSVLLLIYVIFSSFGNTVSQSNHDLILWYDRPASMWEETLPLGNSRLGVMVYGITEREEMQLYEETIWNGGSYHNDKSEALEALPEVRNLIFEGKNSKAAKLINRAFFTRTHGMPYQTAGSVIMNFPEHTKYENYYRELDINRVVATTRYKANEVNYTREVFSSFVDDVIIMKLPPVKRIHFPLTSNTNLWQSTLS